MRGGRGRPRRPGLAAGRGVQLRPLQRGPAGRAGCGNPACLLRERRPPAPAPRTEIAHRTSCALAAEITGRGCAVPRRLVLHPHHTPTFIRTSSAFLPLSLGSQRAKGKKRGRGARGMGSLTQSNDLRGVEQMVPLTPAAERARLSGPPARALTLLARPPNASTGAPRGLSSEGSPTACCPLRLALPRALELGILGPAGLQEEVGGWAENLPLWRFSRTCTVPEVPKTS